MIAALLCMPMMDGVMHLFTTGVRNVNWGVVCCLKKRRDTVGHPLCAVTANNTLRVTRIGLRIGNSNGLLAPPPPSATPRRDLFPRAHRVPAPGAARPSAAQRGLDRMRWMEEGRA